MTASLNELPDVAAKAWLRFRDEVARLLGDNLTSSWGYGGTVFSDRPQRLNDLDTFAVLERVPDNDTKGAIERVEGEIANELGIEWDTFYVLAGDAASTDLPATRSIPSASIRPGRSTVRTGMPVATSSCPDEPR